MRYVRQFPVLFYFVASLLITYVAGIAAYVLLKNAQAALGIDVSSVNDLIMRFGPTLAGLLTMWLVAGTQGTKALFVRILRWRAPVAAYLIAIALPPAITFSVFLLRGYSFELHAAEPATIAGVFVGQLALACVFGGLGEELGWRGFMLPRLCERHNALIASVIVAVAWFTWHIPAYLLTDKAASDPILPFAVIVFPFSIVFTCLYGASGGGLLLPILLHGSINASYYSLERLFPRITESAAFQPGFDWAVAAIWCGVAMLILALYAPRFRAIVVNKASP